MLTREQAHTSISRHRDGKFDANDVGKLIHQIYNEFEAQLIVKDDEIKKLKAELNHYKELANDLDNELRNTQYELSDLKGQRMTNKEAIQAMLDGRKVIPFDWDKGYIYFDKKENIFKDESGARIILASILQLGKWSIADEDELNPKQTITIEKWLCSVVQDSFYVIEGTKEFMSGRLEKVKLLDTYEVTL